MKNVFDKDLNTLILLAGRYSWPRQTYVVSEMRDLICTYLHVLTDSTIETMIKDLDRDIELRETFIEHDIDMPVLLKIRHILVEKLNGK